MNAIGEVFNASFPIKTQDAHAKLPPVNRWPSYSIRVILKSVKYNLENCNIT